MTRLHVYLAAALSWLALAALGAFPTFQLFRRYYGGGPIREWVVNTLLLPAVPRPLAETARDAFNAGTPTTEWLLAVLTLVPYVLALVPVLFAIVHGAKRLRFALRDD